MKWYGSYINRVSEGKQFCEEIKVGTGMTEFSWSDREAYEVIEVRDQKHVTVRKLDHIHVGDIPMDNSWELVSNPGNPARALEKRGNVWYWTTTLTAEDIEGIDDDLDWKIRVCLAGYDIDKIREKGKQTKRWKANVSFGIADYHYDYEF